MRWASRLGLALGVMALLFLVGSFANETGVEGPAQRSIAPLISSTAREVEVRLRIEPIQLLKSMRQSRDRWRLDIVVGVDPALAWHGSDDGGTASERLRGLLRKLVLATDLDRHRIGLAILNRNAQLVHGLSHDRAALLGSIDGIANGNRPSLEAGLHLIGLELSSKRRRSDAIGVVFLLTDGRSSAAASHQAARSLLEQPGIFVLPIAIGASRNETILTVLSSFPGELRSVRSESELFAFYRDWISHMETLVAVDLRVEEQWGGGLLTHLPWRPETAPSQGLDLVWSMPLLTREPALLTYRLRSSSPLSSGFRELAGRLVVRDPWGDHFETSVVGSSTVLFLAPEVVYCLGVGSGFVMIVGGILLTRARLGSQEISLGDKRTRSDIAEEQH